jgi:hypothetical protein
MKRKKYKNEEEIITELRSQKDLKDSEWYEKEWAKEIEEDEEDD